MIRGCGMVWLLLLQERGFLALSKDRHRRRLLDLLRVSISEVPGSRKHGEQRVSHEKGLMNAMVVVVVVVCVSCSGKSEMIDAFAERLRKAALPGAVDRLISESRDCRKTYFYDLYQHKTNGIAM